MKKENLQRIIDMLRTIDETKFDMQHYKNVYGMADELGISADEAVRLSIMEEIECNSPACVIGHAIRLDIPLMQSIMSKDKYASSTFIYSKWSEEFTGLNYFEKDWDWCFASKWKRIDNTIAGAISRIQSLIAGTIELHPHYHHY